MTRAQPTAFDGGTAMRTTTRRNLLGALAGGMAFAATGTQREVTPGDLFETRVSRTN
jgi:hypothetical protein